MDLTVDDTAMKALVAKAIVDSLTPETREKLIAAAVTNALTTPADTGYRRGRSPIQHAFDDAVDSQARKIAEEHLQNDPEFQNRLKGLFADVADKLFAENTRDDLVNSISSVIRAALTKDRF